MWINVDLRQEDLPHAFPWLLNQRSAFRIESDGSFASVSVPTELGDGLELMLTRSGVTILSKHEQKVDLG